MQGTQSSLNGRRLILVLFVAANLLNYLDRYVLAAVLNPIGKSMGLNDAQLGRLALVFLVVYLFSAPVFSYFADRYSRTRLVAGAILLWSLATAAAAFAHNYTTLMITRGLVGIGEAAYATIGPALLADLFPEKDRAKVFTWFYLATPVGSAIGFALGGLVEGYAGWRASFLVAGVPGLLLAGFFWIMKEPRVGQADPGESMLGADLGFVAKYRSLLCNRTFLACTFCYVGYSFAMGALTHWGPTLFQRVYNEETSSSGMILGGIAVVTGIFGTLLGGEITHMYQARYPKVGLWLSFATILAAAPVVSMGIGWLPANVFTAYGLFALGMFLLFINTSPVNAITVSCLPAPLRASGMAANIFIVHILGDAISPALVGERSLQLGSSGAALAGALTITVPAIVISALALLPALTTKKKEEKGMRHIRVH